MSRLDTLQQMIALAEASELHVTEIAVDAESFARMVAELSAMLASAPGTVRSLDPRLTEFQIACVGARRIQVRKAEDESK